MTSKRPELPGILERVLEAYKIQSVSELARRLGLDRSSLYQWKNGDSLPSVATLIKIREETGISIDWILFADGPKVLPLGEQSEFAALVTRIARKASHLASEQHRDFIQRSLVSMEGFIDDVTAETHGKKQSNGH